MNYVDLKKILLHNNYIFIYQPKLGPIFRKQILNKNSLSFCVLLSICSQKEKPSNLGQIVIFFLPGTQAFSLTPDFIQGCPQHTLTQIY